jgi:hypothetical protein
VARMELQIETAALQVAAQRALEPRLYAHCFVSPIPALILDRVRIDSTGPCTFRPGKVTLGLSATLWIVTQEDVIAADGKAPHSSLIPDGVTISVSVNLTLRGTKLSASWGGIVQNAEYETLKNLVAIAVGPTQATALFSGWERVLSSALGASPLFETDLLSLLPSPFNGVQLGRTAIWGTETLIAVRFEVGAMHSDGPWVDVALSRLCPIADEHDWGIFISGDVLTQLMTNAIGQAAAHDGLYPAISSTFSQGAGEDGVVNTVADIPFTVRETVACIPITDHGNAALVVTTAINPPDLLVIKPAINLLLEYGFDVSVGGLLGDLIGIIGSLGALFEQDWDPLSNVTVPSNLLPPNFKPVGSHALLSVIPLPAVSLADTLTLSCTNPGRFFVYSANAGVSVVSYAIEGIRLGGSIDIAPALSPPDCVAHASGFGITLSVASFDGQRPTPASADAAATMTIRDASTSAGAHPLVVGSFTSVGDSEYLLFPALPATPCGTGVFPVIIPEARVSEQYFREPYELAAIVCSNGGARFVKFGRVPQATQEEVDILVAALETYRWGAAQRIRLAIP